jgi:hypothetical protein
LKYRILPHYRGYETRIACATTTPPKKEKITKKHDHGFATSARKKINVLVPCDKPCPSHEG